MAMMVQFLPPPLAQQVDTKKCMQMALCHDIAELLVGDLTPADGVPKPEKHRREAITMVWIKEKILGNADVGGAAQELWQIW